MNDGDKKPSTVDVSPQAQTASLHSVPSTTTNHQNPEWTAIAGKAMTGGKLA